MSDLPIHVVTQEDNEEDFDIDLEILEDVISNDIEIRDEITLHLNNFKTGLESIYALEGYHSAIYGKDILSKSDVKQFNIITETIRNNINYNYKSDNIGLEGISDLLSKNIVTTSISAGIGAVVTGVSVVAGATVASVVKVSELSVSLVEKINQLVISVASEYEIIAKLIEKRWFGIKNLIEVYKLQTDKLEERLMFASMGSDNQLANIKVKLNTVKLADNRKIKTKDQFFKVIKEDITDIVAFMEHYTDSVNMTRLMLADTLKSMAFLRPYKQTMVRNINIFNQEVLTKLSDGALFKGAVVQENTKRSRTLIGGKQVLISHYPERVSLEQTRGELRNVIQQMNIEGSRVKTSNNTNIEIFTFNDVTLKEGKELIELLRLSNDALDKYNGKGVPEILQDRDFFKRITETVTALATITTGFGIIRNFLSNSDNLTLVKQTLPTRLLGVIDTAVKAASLSALVGLVGAKTVGALFDWIRKYIISSLFTSMDLQYKITKILNNVDSSVIDTLISVRGQCFRVSEKLSKNRVWV